MIEVEITIGGHKFRIACAPGEEEQLDSAAKLLDREALSLQSVNGRVPETKMLLMAGLMLGDKVKALEWEKSSLRKNLTDTKKEVDSLKDQVKGFQNQTSLNFEGNDGEGNSTHFELLELLNNTAETLDKLVESYTTLKDKNSIESTQVIEAVEGAFK